MLRSETDPRRMGFDRDKTAANSRMGEGTTGSVFMDISYGITRRRINSKVTPLANIPFWRRAPHRTSFEPNIVWVQPNGIQLRLEAAQKVVRLVALNNRRTGAQK